MRSFNDGLLSHRSRAMPALWVHDYREDPRRSGTVGAVYDRPYRMYFNANCMIRGSRAVRITPNVLPLTAVLGFSARNRFRTLKASARTSNLWLSRRRNTRDSAVSKSHVPTPRTLFRATFPNVPVAGITKAFGFRKFVP